MTRDRPWGQPPKERSTKIGPLIRLEKIKFGGYRRDKIYSTLTCSASKRMKVESRVFFRDENEALELGYRPCGRCMPETY
jgi:hypothetical protein